MLIKPKIVVETLIGDDLGKIRGGCPELRHDSRVKVRESFLDLFKALFLMPNRVQK